MDWLTNTPFLKKERGLLLRIMQSQRVLCKSVILFKQKRRSEDGRSYCAHIQDGLGIGPERTMGVTVPPEMSEEIARQSQQFSAIPPGSCQYSSNLLAKGDLWGVLTPEQLLQRTDGHMDINEVGEGAMVIVPVKVSRAGIYVGDVHAMMGDGEVAGHTTDVSAEVIIEVNVIKGLTIDGPIVLPRCEDLPLLARPYTDEEKNEAARFSQNYGFPVETDMYPVQVVGSGVDLNTATANGS
jgi:acetamidase/formamidase